MTAENPTAPSSIRYREADCGRCGEPQRVPRVFFRGREIFANAKPECSACQAAREHREAEERAAAAWADLCHKRLPARYLAASAGDVRPAYRAALDWRDTPTGGIGLIGPAGGGKSSALACLLKRDRIPFLWWSGTEARQAAIDAATADRDRHGARQRWEHGMITPRLVLDDVSQAGFTPAWSSALFDVLETRLSRNLPTLWTSQKSLADLRAKIVAQNGRDDDQAAAIVRRLSQHSLVLG